jgi:hypothetical protein
MFPGNYAHVIPWNPVQDVTRNLKQTGHMLNEVAHHRTVKDHELITLDDNTKLLGSIGIASLATLGMKQRILGVGEFLGLASWFGAMAATPKLVNAMVWLKTGLDLGQTYDSTYGQRLNLYKDPNYLPLHILSDAQVKSVAKRLNIPDGPNQRHQIEDKMRQISVQAHTWLMLLAGPATAAFAGLMCDFFQDPVNRVVTTLREKVAKMEAERALSAKNPDPELLNKKIQAYLKTVTGEVPGSELSDWWKQFGRKLVRHSGLHKSMTVQDLRHGSRALQLDKLVESLSALAEQDSPHDVNRLKRTHEFLTSQFHKERFADGSAEISGRLAAMQAKTEKFLNRFRNKIDPFDFDAHQAAMDTRLINAQSTINHYHRLFDAIHEVRLKAGGKNPSPEAMQELKRKIRYALTAPNLDNMQELANRDYQKAVDLVGDPDTFRLISDRLKNDRRQYEQAFKLMGATPEQHLLEDALKSEKMGKLWRSRIGIMAAGLLGASALFNIMFVGRDFHKKAPQMAGEMT